MTTYPVLHKVMAIHSPQPVYVLNGMPYYPHYSKPCWVPPGAFVKVYNAMAKMMDYKEDKTKHLSAAELVAAGATLLAQDMWNREWTNGWQEW